MIPELKELAHELEIPIRKDIEELKNIISRLRALNLVGAFSFFRDNVIRWILDALTG
jgi:hypothetical protein